MSAKAPPSTLLAANWNSPKNLSASSFLSYSVKILLYLCRQNDRIMKKVLLSLLMVWGCVCGFAQNVPADSLGIYYEKANALWKQRDFEPAIVLYERLALSGHSESAYLLSNFYQNGVVVEKNPTTAEKWLNIGAKLEQQVASSAISALGTEGSLLQIYAALRYGGELIENGARLNNCSLGVSLIGGAVGSTFISIGATRNNLGLLIAGGVVTGVTGIVSIVLTAVGNHQIRLGGRVFKEFEFSGSGVNVKF